MSRHRLLGRRDLSPSAYVLRIERGALRFTPGQYVTVGAAGDVETREYSVYSGVRDPCLEVLIKEVPDGSVSRRLRRLPAGSPLDVEGPFGFFTVASEHARGPLLFVASGTGIAPFHAMARSDPALDYLLLHGVRTLDDRQRIGGALAGLFTGELGKQGQHRSSRRIITAWRIVTAFASSWRWRHYGPK